MKFLYKSIIFAFILIIGNRYSILALDDNYSFNSNPSVRILNDFSSLNELIQSPSEYIRTSSFNNHVLSNNANEVFASTDSSISLVTLHGEYSDIKWTSYFQDIYITNIKVIKNHLIVSGDHLASSVPETIVKIFNISDSSNIVLDKTFTISGSFIDVGVDNNSVVLFLDFDKFDGYDTIYPYYIQNSVKSYITLDSSLLKSNSSNNSVVVFTKISLTSDPQIEAFKSLIGFGNNLYISNHNLYLTLNDSDSTYIHKFNFSNDIFNSLKSSKVRGLITNYDSFNTLGNDLSIVTAITEDEYLGYGIYYMDSELNLLDSYISETPSFIESIHYTDDMLFIKYNNNAFSESDTWRSVRFFQNGFHLNKIRNFNYSNTVITTNYAFTLNSESNDEISMNIFDKEFNTIGSQTLNTNNSVFLSSHLMAYSDIQPLAAVPIYLKPDVIYPGVIIFKKDESNNISINLMVSPTASESMSYIAHKPDWMKVVDSYLYVFFKDKVMIYDLENNNFVKNINL